MPPAPARAESAVESGVRFGRTKDPDAPQSNRSRQSRERTRGAAADPACGGSASAPRVDQRRRPARPTRAPERAEFAKSVVSAECSLRRSLHGSGRSTPSRDKPLTARLVGRCARERRGANRCDGSTLSAPYQSSVCLHAAPAGTTAPTMTGACHRARCPGASAG